MCGSAQWREILSGPATIQSWKSIAAPSTSGETPSAGIGWSTTALGDIFALPVTYFLLFFSNFGGLPRHSLVYLSVAFKPPLSPCRGSSSWYPLGSHPSCGTWGSKYSETRSAHSCCSGRCLSLGHPSCGRGLGIRSSVAAVAEIFTELNVLYYSERIYSVS